MKVAFCGGGTGGHVYPAMAVAAALRKLDLGEPVDLLYIGVRGKIDKDIVEREGIQFQGVTAGPIRAGNVLATARGGLNLARGAAESFAILGRYKPDVVFATGGYGSVGVGLATRTRRLPLLVFLPDVEAGLAVRTLAKVADRIAVTVPPAQEALGYEKTVLTGYPVREQFFGVDRAEARKKLGLAPDLPTLLVSGASSGAARLNHAVSSWAADFLKVGQLIHLCGRADEAWLRAGIEMLHPEERSRYHLYGYMHGEMPLALAAADLAIMRAGASVLGELPATRLPAILIPGEYEGWDQSPNAVYLQNNEAAVMLRQEDIDELHELAVDLIKDTARLDRMRTALAALAKPDAAERLARLVVEMGRGKTPPPGPLPVDGEGEPERGHR
jgi:UDP-N-acetylglucosamine--N-acetylmuramyl-(pentapeptide) pyrophosphoryl-undecaprenol N-acetylglucosamine transferase